jgi:serine/threonine protein kinase
MPIGIQSQGGAEWKARVVPSADAAVSTLRNIQSHLSQPGKAKGVLTLVNRSHADRELKLERKSGLQLLGRGSNNQRLNDTTHAIRTLLTNAGLDDAVVELDDYLAADKRNGNRISAAKLLELLVTHLPEESEDDGPIFLDGPFERIGSDDLARMREELEDKESEDGGPIYLDGPFEPIGSDELDRMRAENQQALPPEDDRMFMRRAKSMDAAQVWSEVVDRQPAAQVEQQNVAPQPAAQAQQPVQASRPIPYAGADLYPPTAIGRSMDDLLSQAKMSVPDNGTLGVGAFGVVSQLQVPGQATPMVLKTFKGNEQQVLSTARNVSKNEGIAAYLTSKKDSSYAGRVNVVQPEFYLVEQGGKYMMLEPLALRALLKPANSAMGEVHCVGLVMKKADGEEVYEIRNQLSLAQRKQVFKGTVQAVSTLNERGFIHRDIKPENAFFDAGTGKVSLIDTGMLHKRSKNVPGSGQVSNLAGTAPFMHPKIWKEEPHGTEADLYASAMMALELHSPRTMKLIQDVYIKPLRQQYIDRQPISCGDRLFDDQSLTEKIDYALSRLLPPGMLESHDASRKEYEDFKAELKDPNSFVFLIMDCIAVATAPSGRVNWTNPQDAAFVYGKILSDPRLNQA